MKKPMTKMLALVGIFFFLIFGWYGIKKALFFWYVSHYKPPAVTISAAPAKSLTWQTYITTVSTLSAVNGVDIAAEVGGIVEAIHFESGQFVREGDVLLSLRSDIEHATLKSNEAKLKLAQLNYQRDRTLFNKKVAARAVLDARFAELSQAQASVDAVNAQLTQKQIKAPFDGRLGIKQVNLGQYISPGFPLVTLQSLNPLYVIFNVPEQYVNQLHVGQTIDVSVNSNVGKNIIGKITAINAKVEPSTRNILVQATIPNDNLSLFPGMYGLVKIWLVAKNNTVVVPQTAISYSLSGDYVYVVAKDPQAKEPNTNIAKRQYVRVGERRGDIAEILSGLQSGDLVVTAGQLKIQNGAPVLIDDKTVL